MVNIDKMVSRFLSWKLPKDFVPDCGVSFTPFHPNGTTQFEPIGTNILTDDQARQMFEYVLADESDNSPHQQRVLTEKAELDEKLGKLLAFFQSPTFNSLSEVEQSRLRNQARFMDGYAAMLKERIEAFAE